jgi:ATPase subunit of ABC transporter with duplicated ATPase domains
MSNANATFALSELGPSQSDRRAGVTEAAPIDGRSLVLSVRGLSKSFGPTQALSPLDLDIRQGEIHALLGENPSSPDGCRGLA